MARKVKATAESSIDGVVAARKPRKAAAKAKKAKPGPFPLMDMPMDVLLEVLKHVRPIDLLNLARTSKAFRNLLFRRNSRNIWRATFGNTHIRMPPCPEDMSEVAWVNLLYSHHCHECLRKGPHPIYWELRTRYCGTCRKELEVQFEHRLVVHTLKDQFSFEFEPGIDEINIFEIMPVMAKGYGDRVCVLYGVNAFRLCDWEELKHALKHASVKERTKIVLERQARLAKIREGIERRLTDWEIKERHTRSYETWQTQIAREKAIVQKLREHGYGYDYDAMTWDERNEFSLLKEVRQFRPLTDRIWKSIQGSVFEYMEYVRAARKAREEEYGSGEEDDSEYEREEGSVLAAEEDDAEHEGGDG